VNRAHSQGIAPVGVEDAENDKAPFAVVIFGGLGTDVPWGAIPTSEAS
jgi:hypothetical protein